MFSKIKHLRSNMENTVYYCRLKFIYILPVLLTRPQNTVIYLPSYTSKEVQSAMIPSWDRDLAV